MGSAPDETVGASDPRSADLTEEQAVVDHAYACLASMSARTGAAVDDAAERAPGDWDATMAHLHLSRRLASIADGAGPLCFGRIDDEAASWHVGRRHVEDDDGEPVVVDWRAPVSVPFYRATFRDPLGLRRRRRLLLEERRLVDVIDEDFDDPTHSDRAAAAGLPDPLLAELGRARTGAVRDIVATIAAEQDRIIRAPLDTPLVVQGGPGTGKTAVGLHRAAFLLYEHHAELERAGVLVLGPNRVFLTYISEVLPSLGEVAVAQTTLPGLAPQWPVRAVDAPEAAAVKGDARMADVITRAARQALRPPTEPLAPGTRWGVVRLAPEAVRSLLDDALESGGTVRMQRTRFVRAVTRSVTATLSDRRGEIIDTDAVRADLGADRVFQRTLARLWPTQGPVGLVRSLLTRPAVLAAAADGLLDAGAQGRLRRRAAARTDWSEADLPLLDEAAALLGEPPRQYGHVVVDEAQDLSPMAMRMVARRCLGGRSMTVLGDLAQATAPAAQRDWADALAALGSPAGARLEELTVGYRVPRQIVEVANALLAATAPHLRPTTSVRVVEAPPDFVASADSVDTAAREAARLLGDYWSVAVIGDEARLQAVAAVLADHGAPYGKPGQAIVAGTVALVRPADAKGLEFDAVVVLEPAEIMALPGGAGLLYIALTRAVQRLTVIHAGALPPGLRPAA